MYVSIDSRYGGTIAGSCFFLCALKMSASMTRRRVDSERLIFVASVNRSPSAPDALMRSDPARSTRLMWEYRCRPEAGFRAFTQIWKIACDRLDVSFICVAAVARCSIPRSIAALTSCAVLMPCAVPSRRSPSTNVPTAGDWRTRSCTYPCFSQISSNTELTCATLCFRKLPCWSGPARVTRLFVAREFGSFMASAMAVPVAVDFRRSDFFFPRAGSPTVAENFFLMPSSSDSWVASNAMVDSVCRLFSRKFACWCASPSRASLKSFASIDAFRESLFVLLRLPAAPLCAFGCLLTSSPKRSFTFSL
eukprot:gene21495-biopygen21803